MGRFVDIAGLIATFGEDELLQIAGTGDWNTPEGRSIDEAAIGRAIKYADSLVAGYVVARNPWIAQIADPADMPALLNGLAEDIVRYRLRNQAGVSGQMTETVEERYKAALHSLRDIASGKIDLTDPRDGGLLPVEAASDSVRISGGPLTAAPLAEAFLK
ncbi:hypothetical protein AN189_13080 [Loktanella sp. 3ANDIMAR09]|uniref:DUF1320 domain-containing protein n=1 Tax=Loktanella sp. 3ANDIMAR09 TaxID=1225657 RepID=UPI0006F51016|nr:DUF1320 domain-containing protein [Loktanella sp. 3ANDIMAR09]KQI67996.1 hypothetical protein AN189_13080 [Loktanella sp. 3ANDIMAR09]